MTKVVTRTVKEGSQKLLDSVAAYLDSPFSEEDLPHSEEVAVKHDRFGAITAVVRLESGWSEARGGNILRLALLARMESGESRELLSSGDLDHVRDDLERYRSNIEQVEEKLGGLCRLLRELDYVRP